jgi:hypothetical protein
VLLPLLPPSLANPLLLLLGYVLLPLIPLPVPVPVPLLLRLLLVPPPACASCMTQSSWNGFCSILLLHLKQRSRLSNQSAAQAAGLTDDSSKGCQHRCMLAAAP